jgi:ABC-type Na+ transport system ATPase subunit NatA
VIQAFPLCFLDVLVQAVTDLSMNIYNGQLTALLGHNGAGESKIPMLSFVLANEVVIIAACV